ncbi:MAG: 4Fe-4S dicluster domain-containing protein [Deltaproteobacteria bacterium]|nr:4Fe-4S dicluster domain-containing protein [Deltaproteobacteria bacterium]
MQWTPEAEAAVKRIPFFVRKRVRARIEKEAGEAGKNLISLEDVNATKARYLESMESEIKGYQLDTCFGPSGCPNRATIGDELIAKLESLLRKEDLLGFLKQRVKCDIKFHHEFRVTVADCPNACSQPQIKDIGIIGACLPKLSIEPCSRCEACVETCREQAIILYEEQPVPNIDYRKCLGCGKCIPVCPTGTLVEGKKGYRVQVGGKLGRHPRLAREIPGIFDENQVLNIVKACIDFYKKNSISGERFAEILTEAEFLRLSRLYAAREGKD